MRHDQVSINLLEIKIHIRLPLKLFLYIIKYYIKEKLKRYFNMQQLEAQKVSEPELPKVIKII